VVADQAGYRRPSSQAERSGTLRWLAARALVAVTVTGCADPGAEQAEAEQQGRGTTWPSPWV
jgi:hypothetical protein